MRLLLLFFFLSLTYSTFGQEYVTTKNASDKVKKYYEEAYRNASINNFSQAEKTLKNALEKEPTFLDAKLLLANVYYEQDKLEAAEREFEEILRIAPSFNYRVYYNLGLTEKKLKKYSEAAGHLEDFLNTDPSENIKYTAQKHLKSVQFMAYATANPVPFEPKNLGNEVNTPAHEYLPAFTADGETLIFTRNERSNEDFYSSKKIKDKWSNISPLDDINTLENEGAQTVTADGRLLVFTACNRAEGIGSCDLYFSVLENGKYTKPELLPEPINTKYWESQPSLTPNGDALYFSSKRPEGVGEKDIYVSYRVNNKWLKPRNLGTTINTPNDDVTPFIHADGQTLYFTSDGHPGVGKRDLFYSRWQAEEVNWGIPKNLGIPINTEKEEGTLVISLDGKTAYFASDRTDFEEAQGGVDLYSFELYEAARPKAVTYVKAVVKDAITKEPLQTSVEINDLTKNRPFVTAQSDKNGQFLIVMGAGKNYGLSVEKKGYLFYSDNFALQEEASIKKPFLLEIFLTPINETLSIQKEIPERPVILKNVFFETGSSELLPSSINELTRLKNLLENTPSLNIQINGHTDNIGSEEDNLNLSTSRAQSVYDWLVKQGIKIERLSYKGFGETQPIASNDTEDSRKANRRTEFIILR